MPKVVVLHNKCCGKCSNNTAGKGVSVDDRQESKDSRTVVRDLSGNKKGYIHTNEN